MAVLASDNWTPTSAAPSRTLTTGAGVSGRAALQITNNTGWNLLIIDGGTPLAAAAVASAKHVIPPRSTGVIPVQSSTISYTWTGEVNTTGDLIASVFSDDQIAGPSINPGVQAPGNLNDFARADVISRSLTAVSGGTIEGPFTVDGENFYIGGAVATNPLPVDVVVWRDTGSGAGDVVTIIPAMSQQGFNLGGFTFYLGVSAPLYGLAPPLLLPTAASVDFTFYSRPLDAPFGMPLLNSLQSPPLLEYQEHVEINAGGFTVGVPQTLLSVPSGELWCISRVHAIAAGMNTAAAIQVYDNFTFDLSAGFDGISAARTVGRILHTWGGTATDGGDGYYQQQAPMMVRGPSNYTVTLAVTTAPANNPSIRQVTGHIAAWRIA